MSDEIQSEQQQPCTTENATADSFDIQKTFRENVLYFLKEFDLSLHEFGLLFPSVSTNNMRLDNPDYNPTLKTVQLIANAFGIPWDMLLMKHDTTEWRNFELFSTMKRQFRKRLLVDDQTHGILENCILSIPDIEACRIKEKQYKDKCRSVVQKLALRDEMQKQQQSGKRRPGRPRKVKPEAAEQSAEKQAAASLPQENATAGGQTVE